MEDPSFGVRRWRCNRELQQAPFWQRELQQALPRFRVLRVRQHTSLRGRPHTCTSLSRQEVARVTR